LLENAKMRCWGFNSTGQLGLNNNVASSSAQEVILDSSVTAIGAGSGHTCAETATDGIVCWGTSGRGRLGVPVSGSIGAEPGEMPPMRVTVGGEVGKFALGGEHTCALRTDGNVVCWGGNQAGQLGIGNKNDIGDEPGEMPSASVVLW